MKLDRIKFAKLVSWLSYRFNIEIHNYDDLETLDQLCDVYVQPVATQYVEASKVDELLNEINRNDGFIPAIKAYRSLTGVGLKEAKEAVERYRNYRK